MKINWKVRFKNKVWLTSFVTLIVSFCYSVLTMLDIMPSVTQASVMQVANEFLMLLGLMGVVVDPTTEGVGDSLRALSYEKPWVDEEPKEKENEE